MGAPTIKVCTLFVICCAIGTLALPANSSNEQRIVGGFPADNFNIPYIVSVQKFGHHLCGGSIINMRTVLSAAQCFSVDRPSAYRVLVGSKTTLISDGQLVSVDALHKHERYRTGGMDYDICLVRLSHFLTFSAHIRPIVLPRRTDELIDGIFGVVSGWGVTDPNDSKISDKLRTALVPIVNQAVCKSLLESFKDTEPLTDRMLCAGFLKGGVDSCRMDNGGPLVVQSKLVGIVSSGVGCAKPNKPSVYTRVSYFIPWIKYTMWTQYNEAI